MLPYPTKSKKEQTLIQHTARATISMAEVQPPLLPLAAFEHDGTTCMSESLLSTPTTTASSFPSMDPDIHENWSTPSSDSRSSLLNSSLGTSHLPCESMDTSHSSPSSLSSPILSDTASIRNSRLLAHDNLASASSHPDLILGSFNSHIPANNVIHPSGFNHPLTSTSASSSSSSLSSLLVGADPLTSQLVPPAASALGSIPLSAILQRLPGVWYIIFLIFVTFGPVYSPILFSFFYLVMHVFFIINNVRMALSARTMYLAAKLHSSTDWTEKYCQTTGAASAADPSRELPLDDIMHVVIVPNYKEEMETLCETLEVLASHSHALTQYKICLAMEATEAGSDIKARKLLRQFQDQFYDLTFTIHPADILGEVRGKSSNVSWAAREMAHRSSPSTRAREIVTVMDADTCFAQDYFSAIAYHYAVSKPADRKITMFAPCTVFDRNASNVPVFVRTADMVWSAGVMSNLSPSSPIKVPCSAYSLSMDLAVAVGFWDTDPGSIGEDMHMYLKCFYATEGRVLVHSIASPASQCNIQGSSWIDTMQQRYTQSKRHMWGSLDVGYIVRRALFALFAPGYDAPAGQLQEVPLIRSEETRGSQDVQISITNMMHLFHRIFEANMIMGQVFMLVFITSITLPVANSPSPFAASFWSLLSEQEVHPYVSLAASLGGYIRTICAIPFIVMIYNYEKYFFWVSTERWIWSLREQVRPGSGQRVQPLGKRSQLVSTRNVFSLLDWLALPACGILFLASPQIHAQILQLFTDRLDYAVASKPTLAGKSGAHPSVSSGLVPLDAVEVIPLESVQHQNSPSMMAQLSKDAAVSYTSNHNSGQSTLTASRTNTASLKPAPRGARPMQSRNSIVSTQDSIDCISTVSSRGDSGFYEFDDSHFPADVPLSPSQFTPAMWKQYRPARSTLSSEWSDGDGDFNTSPTGSANYTLNIE